MKADTALSDPLDLNTLPAELRIVLGRLIRRLRAEYGFSMTHASVLGRLDRDGPQCIGELAAAERVRPQSMSQTLAELEADNLIKRRPDLADGRRTQIALTNAGRRALEADRAARDGWLGQEISQFTLEEQETLREAIALLQRLASAP